MIRHHGGSDRVVPIGREMGLSFATISIAAFAMKLFSLSLLTVATESC